MKFQRLGGIPCQGCGKDQQPATVQKMQTPANQRFATIPHAKPETKIDPPMRTFGLSGTALLFAGFADGFHVGEVAHSPG
jgi:hypothetical protein